MTARSLLLSGAALLFAAAPAAAQDAAQPAPAVQQAQDQPDADEPPEGASTEGGAIVVTGKRSVIGDIPPENVLDSRDVQATGATDINELLDALAPQIGSSQGRGGERPILLLDGHRISSFRELRDIPTEAIRSVEILPEEVALRYGYSADQKVVNFVLWPRFRSTAALLSGKDSTEGGYVGAGADVTRLMIGESGRTTVNLHAEGNGMITEDERDILLEEPVTADNPDPRPARSLVGSKRDLRGTVTFNRNLGDVAATGNVELEHSEGRSLIGLGDSTFLPLARDTASDSAHAGFVLDGDKGNWRWSVTGNGDASRNVTESDNDGTGVRDRAVSNSVSAGIDAMANGKVFDMPAGEANATFKLGASTLHFDSDRNDDSLPGTSLGRSSGQASANFDLPISRRGSSFATLGNLSLNANGKVEQLSDFGTLATLGAGANWSPVKRLNLLGSWTREEGAPTVNQLGDPVLETPNTRIFDFTTGQTVLVTAVTGGNPDLKSDRRSVWKLGANWKPFEDADLTLRADYVNTRIDNPISNFPGPTTALEEAFPDRFVRDSEGDLVSVDLRPVNYEYSRRDTLTVGFDFTKSLKSAAPSQAAIAAFRARRAQAEQQQARTEAAPPPEGGPPPGEAGPPPEGGPPPGGGRGPGGGGFGRFGGGRNGGRLQFSLTDTITLVDQVTIRDDLKLDYLHGDAAGQSGGRARHQVQARAGYFNNGLGARLSANWQSATDVTTSAGDQLHFSPLATFDLRLWANLGQKYDLVAKHPFFRGTSIRFEVGNLFDAKPRVRDSFGSVPIGYQPDLLDPLGRTISITFRKLFLPPPSFFRRPESSGGGGED